MESIAKSIQLAVKEVFDVDTTVELTRPAEQFGDLATNVAMQLAKSLGKPPRDIAEALAAKLQDHPLIREANIAGPGFLNLLLCDAALAELATATADQPLAGKTVLVEYSDPNPFKPLHAGHLYTTLVGDMIARLIEQAGAKVVRLNYGGDVGLHVGKSMWAIIQSLGGEQPEKLDTIPAAERPAWLGARYVEGNNAYEDDEAARQEIIETNKRVYELHTQGDRESAFARIYWTCRQWSYDYFAELYKQLEVSAFDRFIPESEVTPLGLETVRQQLAQGVFEESDQAIIFNGEQHGLHTRVFINSEGLPTYEAKEVGLSLTKWQDYQFDRSVIITANEQAQFMQVVLKAVEQFAPEITERTTHITHGVVKLQGGVKMSSRKGNVVTALEILEAARVAGTESGTNPDEHTILAAVKYAFAKNRIGGDIIYDPAESIALEGNSGPYLQYAHARACSILAKAPAERLPLEDIQFDPAERSLVRKLGEFTEVVDRSVADLMPHHICVYLYELAQAFNRFYEDNRVIGSDREVERLTLVASYAQTLRRGLSLLGIHAPEKM